MRDWARYWRAQSAPVEAMHAHFTKHVYHRHSHESYSFGVTEAGAQAFTCRPARAAAARAGPGHGLQPRRSARRARGRRGRVHLPDDPYLARVLRGRSRQPVGAAAVPRAADRRPGARPGAAAAARGADLRRLRAGPRGAAHPGGRYLGPPRFPRASRRSGTRIAGRRQPRRDARDRRAGQAAHRRRRPGGAGCGPDAGGPGRGGRVQQVRGVPGVQCRLRDAAERLSAPAPDPDGPWAACRGHPSGRRRGRGRLRRSGAPDPVVPSLLRRHPRRVPGGGVIWRGRRGR
jgi:hypothetical protein